MLRARGFQFAFKLPCGDNEKQNPTHNEKQFCSHNEKPFLLLERKTVFASATKNSCCFCNDKPFLLRNEKPFLLLHRHNVFASVTTDTSAGPRAWAWTLGAWAWALGPATAPWALGLGAWAWAPKTSQKPAVFLGLWVAHRPAVAFSLECCSFLSLGGQK